MRLNRLRIYSRLILLPLLFSLYCLLLAQNPLSRAESTELSPKTEASTFDRFHEIANQYLSFNLALNNHEELKTIVNMLDKEIMNIDQIEEVRHFPFSLKLLSSIQRKTHDLLGQAEPGSDIQKKLIFFFDKAYQDEFVLHNIYGQKTFKKLGEAFNLSDTYTILELSELFREVGTPDFQIPLWRMMVKVKDERIKSSLLSALGKIGNQHAAHLVYQALQTSPQKMLLNALVELGLPDFDFKQEKKPSTVKRLIRKETPVRDLHRFYRNFHTFNQELESIFSRLNLPEEEKSYYRSTLLQTRGHAKQDGDFSFLYRGIAFEEGDVIISTKIDPVSSFWGTMTNYPLSLSHVSVVTFTDNGFPLVAEIGHQVNLVHLEDALSIPGDFLVLRYKNMSPDLKKRLKKAVNFYYQNRKVTKFDGDFDRVTDYLFYCAEFVYHVYRRTKAPINWVYSEFPTPQAKMNMENLGIHKTDFITQGDFLRVPEFSLKGIVYNRAFQSRLAGGILVDIYVQNYKTKEMDFNRVPRSSKYKLISNAIRFMNARDARNFNKKMEYAMVAFFGSFEEIYNRAMRKAKEERLTITSYASYQRRIREILEEEAETTIQSVFKQE